MSPYIGQGMADRQFLDPASPLNQELEWETVINDRSLPVSYTTVKYQHATDREPSWDLDYATKSHSRRRALNTSGSEEGLGSPVSKRKELDTFSDSERMCYRESQESLNLTLSATSTKPSMMPFMCMVPDSGDSYDDKALPLSPWLASGVPPVWKDLDLDLKGTHTNTLLWAKARC